MQLKDSILLLSALSAGSAAARLHGHERRHAHPVEKRGLGDLVKIEMDGKMVSWTNEWSGAAATTAPSEPAATPAFQAEGGATQVVTVAAVPTASQSASPSSSSSSSAPAGGSCGNWHDNPSGGEFSREGFGSSTLDNDQDYVFYKGNVGSPWGSNIQEVSESNACNYRYVIAVHGSVKDPWTMVFWNKIGPDGGINGWYSGSSALTLTIDAGETKYVAFDSDSQGSWGAAKGTELPTDKMGGYSCTWGEFDFGNSKNSRDLPDGHTWSGWDVSAIQAQNANQDVQGMKICQHSDRGCSSISNLAKNVVNAYTAAEEGVDGIGGNYKGNDGVRLHVTIDFDE